MDSVARRAGNRSKPSVADQSRLEREIEVCDFQRSGVLDERIETGGESLPFPFHNISSKASVEYSLRTLQISITLLEIVDGWISGMQNPATR